ncbi:MAG: LysR family transcriptional regulator [Lachnospiraceae bacterium]|jgi:DNA-binding transcriptional LysR family regulator|nr:LysR family transcriptional regulator [Lachnospiraceae bacterium]
MELRNLKTFLEVADSGNFTKTAQSLGYSQSAVTAQIKQLELELGVPVFDRLGKSISLTEAGKKLYQYAQEMLNLEQDALDSIKNKDTMTGELRMGIEESLAISFLPDILYYYRFLHPDVDLIVKVMDFKSMLSALKDNDIDLIYTLDRLYEKQDLARPRELAEPIHFICASTHPLASKETVSISEIVNEPFIFTGSEVNYRIELENQLTKMNLHIRPLLEVLNTDIICRLVSMGIGLSFVPECVCRAYVDDGSVKILNVPEISISMYRQMLFYKDKWQTPQMKAMIHLLTEIDF